MQNILQYLKYKLCNLIKYLMAQLLHFEVVLVRFSPIYPYLYLFYIDEKFPIMTLLKVMIIRQY